jgi:hypothetical protein
MAGMMVMYCRGYTNESVLLACNIGAWWQREVIVLDLTLGEVGFENKEATRTLGGTLMQGKDSTLSTLIFLLPNSFSSFTQLARSKHGPGIAICVVEA